MKYQLLSSISDTIEKYQQEISEAENFIDKVQIFFETYKVWILVGLVVIFGIVMAGNLIAAKHRKEDREDRREEREERRDRRR